MPRSRGRKPKKKQRKPKVDRTRPVRGIEWLGKRVNIGYLEAEQAPALLEIWMALPGELIVHQEVHAGKAEWVTPGLRAAVADSGDPPVAIRVNNRTWARELRAAYPDIQVRVGRTPELDEVVRSMRDAIGGGGPLPYVMAEVDSPLMADLFDAAATLYETLPWRLAQEWQTIRLDMPELGVENWCISIIGATAESYGVLAFQSADDYIKMALASEAMQSDDDDIVIGAELLSLSFDRGAELTQAARREIRRHRWLVAGPNAYPAFNHVLSDGTPVPLSREDARALLGCVRGLAVAFAKHPADFDPDTPHELEVTIVDPDVGDVRLTYPSMDLFPFGEPALPTTEKAQQTQDRLMTCLELDEDLTTRLDAFAGERWPEVVERALRELARMESTIPVSLALYHTPVEGEATIASLFLERERTNRQERDWVEAQAASWLSAWEFIELREDSEVLVRDRFTGVELVVFDVGFDRGPGVGWGVLARLVPIDDERHAVFGSMGVLASPEDLATFEAKIRKYLRRKRAVDPERLRDPKVARHLVKRWRQDISEPFYQQLSDLEEAAEEDASFAEPPALEAHFEQHELPFGDSDPDAIAASFKRDYYRRWLDNEIPALGGKTPRQAATSAGDRERLVELIDGMEVAEQLLPQPERHDFDETRRALGLPARGEDP